jgi:hypothetical protein
VSRSRFAAIATGGGLALLLSGCIGFENRSTISPSDAASLRSYVGEWTSAAGLSQMSFPTRESCGGLKWKVTTQDSTSMAGEFQASCAGDIILTGVASGRLDGSIRFEASGMATGGSLPASCPFSLTGVGDIENPTTLRVTYTGQTCVGPIGGVEILHR